MPPAQPALCLLFMPTSSVLAPQRLAAGVTHAVTSCQAPARMRLRLCRPVASAALRRRCAPLRLATLPVPCVPPQRCDSWACATFLCAYACRKARLAGLALCRHRCRRASSTKAWTRRLGECQLAPFSPLGALPAALHPPCCCGPDAKLHVHAARRTRVGHLGAGTSNKGTRRLPPCGVLRVTATSVITYRGGGCDSARARLGHARRGAAALPRRVAAAL